MRGKKETINWEAERLHIAEKLFLEKMKKTTTDMRYIDQYSVREIAKAAKNISLEFIEVMRYKRGEN